MNIEGADPLRHHFAPRLWGLITSLSGVFFFSALVAMIMPERSVRFFASVDLGIWIYSLLITFFIDIALQRKARLKENVGIELNHLRHLTHTVEQLGAPEWRERVFAAIDAYHRRISESFLSHPESSEAFRAFSHEIYSYQPATEREQVIVSDALSTLRDASMVREEIRHELLERFSWPHWARLVVTCISTFMLLVLPHDTLFEMRLSLTFALFVLVMPLELLVHSNSLSSERVSDLQSQYRRNIGVFRHMK